MVDWNVAFAIFIAIVAAGLVQKWLERQQAASLNAAQRGRAIEAPQTVDEYVRRHYPGAYNA